jgi:hypothetical protein
MTALSLPCTALAVRSAKQVPPGSKYQRINACLSLTGLCAYQAPCGHQHVMRRSTQHVHVQPDTKIRLISVYYKNLT